jgi:hypothetical protein
MTPLLAKIKHEYILIVQASNNTNVHFLPAFYLEMTTNNRLVYNLPFPFYAFKSGGRLVVFGFLFHLFVFFMIGSSPDWPQTLGPPASASQCF